MNRPSSDCSYEPNTITLISYPGAGKGTLTKQMLRDLHGQNIPTEYYEVGDTVRSNIKQGTEFGRLAVEFNDRGLLVPDEHIVPVVRDAIGRLMYQSVWFLDGFPRSGSQVKPYEEMIDELQRSDVILNLELDKDPQNARAKAEERMMQRLEWMIAHGQEPRKDDKHPELRKKRLDEAAKLHDVIGHFEGSGRLLTIDANLPPEQVLAQVRRNFSVRLLEAADLDEEMSERPTPRFVYTPQMA